MSLLHLYGAIAVLLSMVQRSHSLGSDATGALTIFVATITSCSSLAALALIFRYCYQQRISQRSLVRPELRGNDQMPSPPGTARLSVSGSLTQQLPLIISHADETGTERKDSLSVSIIG